MCVLWGGGGDEKWGIVCDILLLCCTQYTQSIQVSHTYTKQHTHLNTHTHTHTQEASVERSIQALLMLEGLFVWLLVWRPSADTPLSPPTSPSRTDTPRPSKQARIETAWWALVQPLSQYSLHTNPALRNNAIEILKRCVCVCVCVCVFWGGGVQCCLYLHVVLLYSVFLCVLLYSVFHYVQHVCCGYHHTPLFNHHTPLYNHHSSPPPPTNTHTVSSCLVNPFCSPALYGYAPSLTSSPPSLGNSQAMSPAATNPTLEQTRASAWLYNASQKQPCSTCPSCCPCLGLPRHGLACWSHYKPPPKIKVKNLQRQCQSV